MLAQPLTSLFIENGEPFRFKCMFFFYLKLLVCADVVLRIFHHKLVGHFESQTVRYSERQRNNNPFVRIIFFKI